MKFYIFLLCAFLTGCYTAHSVYNKTEPYEVDKKILELKQTENRIDDKNKALEKYVAELGRDRVIKVEPAPAPPEKTGQSYQIASIDIPISGSNPVVEKHITIKSSKKINHTERQINVSEQLYSASAIFSVPLKANISEDIKAQLIIDPKKSIEELKSSVRGQMQAAEKIKVSKIVISIIDAPDFIVTNLTPNEQALSDTDKTEWLWTLRPRSPGLHEINLSITAEVMVDSKYSKYHIRTFDKQVMIEITPIQLVGDWWSKYWQWVVSTLILPLLVFVYKKKFTKIETT